jgi:60 kDa SS-A/Ro ribonucleoprotein
VRTSEEGRAPKNDPTLFALATAADGLPRLVEGFVFAQAAMSPKRAAALVREYGLPREAVKPEHLTSPEVWSALLDDMPMMALIRNLATMTRIGVIVPGSDGTAKAVAQLGDRERIRKARVDPITLLAALRTYGAVRGVRGRLRLTAAAPGTGSWAGYPSPWRSRGR